MTSPRPQHQLTGLGCACGGWTGASGHWLTGCGSWGACRGALRAGRRRLLRRDEGRGEGQQLGGAVEAGGVEGGGGVGGQQAPHAVHEAQLHDAVEDVHPRHHLLGEGDGGELLLHDVLFAALLVRLDVRVPVEVLDAEVVEVLVGGAEGPPQGVGLGCVEGPVAQHEVLQGAHGLDHLVAQLHGAAREHGSQSLTTIANCSFIIIRNPPFLLLSLTVLTLQTTAK